MFFSINDTFHTNRVKGVTFDLATQTSDFLAYTIILCFNFFYHSFFIQNNIVSYYFFLCKQSKRRHLCSCNTDFWISIQAYTIILDFNFFIVSLFNIIHLVINLYWKTNHTRVRQNSKSNKLTKSIIYTPWLLVL